MSDENPLEDIVGDVAEEATGPGRLERAAGIAQKVLRHKQLLVAAMEMLRERAALSEEEEVKIISAYESGTATARAALNDLVEKLQKANFGKVIIDLGEKLQPLAQNIQPEDLSVEGIRARARPAIQAVKEEVMAEARPYIERAKQRLQELKVLEEPTIRRLEGITGNLKDASKEIALGLKGAGREAADELVRRGKRWWMSAETEELEREFFDWVLKTLPKAERSLVHILLGVGILLFASGILLAAQEFGVLKELAIFLAIFLMLAVGLTLINWGIKISEAMKAGRGEIERLARMSPQERRVFLTKRWAQRAQSEGVITSNEAKTVIEETIRAAPEDAAASPGSAKAPMQVQTLR